MTKSRRGSTSKAGNLDMNQAGKDGRDDAIKKLKAMRNDLQSTLLGKRSEKAKQPSEEGGSPTQEQKEQEPPAAAPAGAAAGRYHEEQHPALLLLG